MAKVDVRTMGSGNGGIQGADQDGLAIALDNGDRKGIESGNWQAVAADDVGWGGEVGEVYEVESRSDLRQNASDGAHERTAGTAGSEVLEQTVKDSPIKGDADPGHKELVKLDGQLAGGLDVESIDRPRGTTRLQESYR